MTATKLARKKSGAIYTPGDIARFLVEWAVSRRDDRVLDLGIGEGAFALEAYKRLHSLGTAEPDAQVFGCERDEKAFSRFMETVAASGLGPFPNVRQADFFASAYPTLDAIIGNPPYVSRVYLKNIDTIRTTVLPLLGTAGKLYRLADLYCYFILHATQFLQPGGRLAVILSSSWLDTNFGRDFKRFLLHEYAIKGLIAFEGRVFSDAWIKAVLLFAEKGSHNGHIAFVRAKGALTQHRFDNIAALPDGDYPDLWLIHVPQSSLLPETSWSFLLKRPDVVFELEGTGKFCKLRKLADSRIGVQSLARDFFILDAQRAKRCDIEEQYLQPLAFGPRTVSGPAIAAGDRPSHYLFAASDSIDALLPGARRHVEWGMSQAVAVRGTTWRAPGYHQAPRLRKSGRKPWYNLWSHLKRRGRWPILLPRRVYTAFTVVWNQAGWIANEDFMEVRPKREEYIVPLLSVLNSHFGEFAIRSQAQQYGGGVYNLLPSDVPQLLVPNIEVLSHGELKDMACAYDRYLVSGDKDGLTRSISVILQLDPNLAEQLIGATQELRGLAARSKTVRPNGTE
jgi:methylase of polypeptide subunit release factors